MTTRRNFFIGASVTGVAVAIGGLLGLEFPIKSLVCPAKEIAPIDLWKDYVRAAGIAGVGKDEKGPEFQRFMLCIENAKAAGCKIFEMHGRVFGPDTGHKDLVDTIWVRFGDDKMWVFESERSVVKETRMYSHDTIVMT